MSERKLASIRRISQISPIEGADVICAYKVDGWWVVGKVGEYEVNDLALYFEIDSWLPTELAPFLSKGKEPRVYNGVSGERLKTVKLRGQLSQGLLLPLSVLGDENFSVGIIGPSFWHKNDITVFLEEGADCTEYLGIQKWEAPEFGTNPMSGGMPRGKFPRGNFPHFIRKTDEERIQNIRREIREAFERGDKFEVTMKLDGSSCTAYHNNGDLGVCSRNIDLKLESENSKFVDACASTGLISALGALGRNIAVQGELMGPGIQKNREKFDSHKLFPFKVWDIDNQKYLSPEERLAVLEELAGYGFKYEHVPILDPDFMLFTDDIDTLLTLADGPSINHKIREGVVLKRHDGEFSFKIISNKFLLKEE